MSGRAKKTAILIKPGDSDKIRLIGRENGAVGSLPAGSKEFVRKIVSKKTILEVIGKSGFIRIIQASNDKIRRERFIMKLCQNSII